MLLSAVLLFAYAAAERARLENSASEQAGDITAAIDKELSSLLTAAELLALSPQLESGDLVAFDRLAREAQKKIGAHVVVRNREHQQIINTRLPFGSPLPPMVDIESDERVLASGRAEISDLIVGSVTKTPLFMANAPVYRGAEIAYFVNLSLQPERLRDLMLQEGIAEGWVGAVGDRKGTIIARTRAHEQFVGKPSAPGLLEATQAPSGIWRGVNVEGISVVFAYRRSPLTNWLIGVGVPGSVLEAPLKTALWRFGAFAVLLSLLSALLAWLISRRLAQPIADIAKAGHLIVEGQSAPLPVTAVREVNSVQDALARSFARHIEDQNRLRESAARLQRLTEATREGVCIHAFGRIHDANAALARMFGYAEGEVCGLDSYDLIAPDQRRFARERAEANDDRPYESLGLRKDGTTFPIELVGQTQTRDGQPVRYVTVRDLSEQKAVEEALRFSRQRLNAVLDNATVAIFMMDERQHCVYMNAAAEKLTGYSMSEMQGRSLHGIIRHARPDGSQFSRAECPIDRAFPQNHREQGEEVFVHKDGTFYPVAFTASPIRDETAKAVGTIIEMRDIRAEKAAAEHVRLIMGELSHRSKNLLAVVQAMVRQTARRASSMEAFQEELAGRIGALASAHDVLVSQNWEGAPLRGLCERQLQPFVDLASERVVLDGPDLKVTAAAAQNLALAIHELATNACKHGALSGAQGRVRLNWRIVSGEDGKQRFQFRWEEQDGPRVAPPSRSGFGSFVLERMVSAGFSGCGQVEYAPDGLNWTLTTENLAFITAGQSEPLRRHAFFQGP